MFGHTNNITINRWLAGKDIYISSLVQFCNYFKTDILSFFTYEGKTFNTNIGDIIKLEKAGLDIQELLRQNNIDPCTPEDSLVRAQDELPTDDPSHPHYTKQPASIGTNNWMDNMPASYLDQFIKFQCNAHEHERQMLEQQRIDMQSIIDDKDKQIKRLEKEVKRLLSVERASKPYFGAVADDSATNG